MSRAFDRMILIDRLTTLVENPDVGTTAEQAEIETRLKTPPLAPIRVIECECPMCGRIFYKGDALCSYKAADAIKGPDGELAKCPPRVVGFSNRHMQRSFARKAVRLARKLYNARTALARLHAVPVVTKTFTQEAASVSPTTAQ